MIENVWFVAATWMALALAASLISIWTGISVALIEILVGVAAGNLLHLRANTEWINFLALLGANFSSPGQRGDSPDLFYYPPSFSERPSRDDTACSRETRAFKRREVDRAGYHWNSWDAFVLSVFGRPLGEPMCITTFAVTLAVTFFDREAPRAS